MQKKYTVNQLNDIWEILKREYHIIGPKKFTAQSEFSGNDYIGYGNINTPSDLIADQKSHFSPKEVVFPVRETLLTFTSDRAEIPPIDERPVIVFLRACDINGFSRLDQVFLNNGPHADFYYKRLREKVILFLIECTESFETCFCVSMDANKTDTYSAAFRFSGEYVYANVKDERFSELFDRTGDPCKYTPGFVKENYGNVAVPAVESLNISVFNHELWDEYTRRCIGCGRCNTSCATCSCFTIQDVTDEKSGSAERRRRWAGCHIPGFTDMAGGHSFRKKSGDKMRFKTLHKINDFHRRFGFHMCVGCGRCDDVCPEHISFAECINRLSKIIEIQKNNSTEN